MAVTIRASLTANFTLQQQALYWNHLSITAVNTAQH